MTTRAVKYWKRLDADTYEPHSTSTRERNLLMHYRDEIWCTNCKAVVEPVEMNFRVGGWQRVCPFCEE